MQSVVMNAALLHRGVHAGKSTLADQLLIKTDTVENRDMQASRAAMDRWQGPVPGWTTEGQPPVHAVLWHKAPALKP